MSTQSPKELHAIRKQRDERKLEDLRNRLLWESDDITRRSLALAIEETEARLQRENSPEVLAALDAWQVDHERREYGDPAQRAAEEAAIANMRAVQTGDAYRRKVGEYGLAF